MSFRDRIEKELSKYPEGLTVKELAKKMNHDSLDLAHSLRKMSYKGRVDQDKDGRWKTQ